MAEPFKSTPASRVFGMGLPRRKVDNPGTIFGIEVDEPRWSLDARLRRDMAEEQEMALQEQALAAQQQKLQRQMRGQQAMDQAYSDLEKGEEIENIFRKNPAMMMSPDFGQFVQASRYLQPSKAAQAVVPNLAKKLPVSERDIFNQLINTPQFANNPFAAYDEAQRRGARSKQHGELVKAGVPLAKVDMAKDYSPVEFQDLINQYKKPDTGNNFTNKIVEQALSRFEEEYRPPEGMEDPIAIAMDIAEKKDALLQRIMGRLGGGQSPNLGVSGGQIQNQVAPPAANANLPKMPRIQIGTPIQIPL
jgi:hypothetical protein